MNPAIVLLRLLFGLLAAALPVPLLLHYPSSTAFTTFDAARFGAWVASLAGLLGLFVMAGLKINGRGLGVLIDERNRYSLSRLQVSLWTLLVLATLYVVFIANIVRGNVDIALKVDLDYNLVILMGFSVASFVAAPMALSLKSAQPADDAAIAHTAQQLQSTQGLENKPAAAGRVLVKGSPADARLADLIRGEDVANAMVVDLPRLQMLLITAVVVLTYGAALGSSIAGVGAQSWVLKALPRLHDTLLLLVLVSHGGYVAGKLIPSNSPGSAADGQQLARALQASQRAASLATELQTRLDTTAAADPRYGWLRSCLALARSAAADASALPGRFSDPSFKADEIASVEGRIDALQNSLSAQPVGLSSRQIVDAPAPETVRKIQHRLFELGHADVATSGIADAITEQAIGAELAKVKVSRSDLHPRAYRYYEEVAQLLA